MLDRNKIKRVYQFIVQHSQEYRGHFPTHRQIQDACHISSTSIVAYYLGKLEAEGLILQSGICNQVVGAQWLPPVAPDGEIETEPTEAAPDGAGYAQSKGVRPSLLHGRAVDKAPNGDGWKRVGQPPRAGACPRCGIALPVRTPAACENCGQRLSVGARV